jgi:hypothetical protein
MGARVTPPAVKGCTSQTEPIGSHGPNNTQYPLAGFFWIRVAFFEHHDIIKIVRLTFTLLSNYCQLPWREKWTLKKSNGNILRPWRG